MRWRGAEMELLTDCLKAFAVGGALCAVGQILIDRTALTPARILTLYVVTGTVLGALGLLVLCLLAIKVLLRIVERKRSNSSDSPKSR